MVCCHRFLGFWFREGLTGTITDKGAGCKESGEGVADNVVKIFLDKRLSLTGAGEDSWPRGIFLELIMAKFAIILTMDVRILATLACS